MDCDKLDTLLDGYLDRELDRESAATVERHLALCESCRHRLDARKSLASSIRKHAIYHPAPAALANRIRAQIAGGASSRREHTRERRVRFFEWTRWMQLGGALAAAVLVTSLVTLQLSGTSEDQRIVEQVLNGHSRALLTSHQIDVASSDQHTVKPWLSSKLDFSPVVTDLGAAGFPLRGGRLDYVNNRPVAVLVYGHRQHVIDLFIWPDDTKGATMREHSFAKRGLNVLHWTAGGMTYWAVSDVTGGDLASFADHYTRALK
jgi:anti-sigma factor RsiW